MRGLYELPDQRTYFSKTYYNAGDDTYKTIVSAGYMHYQAADGAYKEINTKLRLDTSGVYYIIDQGLYNVAFTFGIGQGSWDVVYEVPRPVYEKVRDPGRLPPPTRLRWKVLSTAILTGKAGYIKFFKMQAPSPRSLKATKSAIRKSLRASISLYL